MPEIWNFARWSAAGTFRECCFLLTKFQSLLACFWCIYCCRFDIGSWLALSTVCNARLLNRKQICPLFHPFPDPRILDSPLKWSIKCVVFGGFLLRLQFRLNCK